MTHNLKYLSFLLVFSVAILFFTYLYAEGGANTGTGRKVVQFSGLVVTGDSLKPIPYSTIRIKNSRRGTITDFHGFFSITVRARDTIHFTSVGFKDVLYVVPDTLTSARYSTVQLMTADTIHLPETVIYPWPTKEQFRHAFLNTEIPDDDLDRAMRNLERAEMKERLERMPLDGYSSYRNMIARQGERMYYAGQRPPMRIFDPFAWSEFIQAWRDGRFRRSD